METYRNFLPQRRRGRRRLGAFSGRRWFYRILRNAVIDHYRRLDTRRRALESFARELGEAVPPTEVHDEVCACIWRLATTLEPEYEGAPREIEVEGRPLEDYAEGRGITPNNAAVCVHRARQALRKQSA